MMTYFAKNKEMSFGPNLLTMKSTHILSDFVWMGDQKYLPLIFPSLVTCLLTKTRGVQDFLEEDKEKKWIKIPVSPTFYDSFRVSKVGNFTTGVGKVTNFIFTQLLYVIISYSSLSLLFFLLFSTVLISLLP